VSRSIGARHCRLIRQTAFADGARSDVTYPQQRDLLIGSGLRGPKLRRALAEAADDWMAQLFGAVTGAALVGVGGYGRGELSPGSDLDIILLHDGTRSAAEIAALADAIWYPIWDSKVKLDHSVRTVAEARDIARADLPAALGLFTARTVAGDGKMTTALRDVVLADWRARAPRRLPEVKAARAERLARHGELAYRLEGDLKESVGGLRDAYSLAAISASWLADVPHGEPEAALARLLDIRDALHIRTGRATDRLSLQDQDDLAADLGLESADALLTEVSEAARTIAYACDVAWRRVDQVLAARGRTRLRPLRQASARTPLADGVVAAEGEAALALAADPRDPVLVLRLASAAALAGLPPAAASLRRLAAEGAELPTPWPRAAREEFIRLLGAGPGLVSVWESLDRTGLLTRLLPEWTRIRSLPQRNALHVHTVDRHMVQAAVHAAQRTRRVSRPDLLLIAALCHDLGKGLDADHCEVGAVIVADLMPRLGFDAADTAVVVALVRHHLLFAQLAVHRDPADPATLDALLAAARVTGGSVGPAEFIALLHALTEADSQATGPAVWNRWRSGLLDALGERAKARLAGSPHPVPVGRVDGSALAAIAAAAPDRLAVQAIAADAAHIGRIDIVVPDAVGALALVAGVLTVRHIRILGAEAESVTLRVPEAGALPEASVQRWAVQRWTVAAEYGELPEIARLRTDLRAAIAGRLDLGARMAARDAEQRPLGRGAPIPPPAVTVLPGASAVATVLEIRARDTPGLLYRVADSIARCGADIGTARIATLGVEALDVLYLLDATGRPLSAEHQGAVVAAVTEAIRGTGDEAD
jgi:[protein-PII] uridylyltransferase